MKKLVTIFITAFLIILLLPFAQVHAYGSTTFSLPATPRYGHPQLCSTHLTNGLYVYVYADDVQNVYVEIYNSAGVHQAQVTFDVNDACSHYALEDIQRLSVIALDDDEILISMAVQNPSGDEHRNIGVARVHTETYAVIKRWGTEEAVLSATYDMYPSQIFQNGTNFFGIVTEDYLNDGAFEHWYWKFDSVTNTFSDTRDTTITHPVGQIFGFHDSADNTMVYLIGSVEGDENRSTICKWDLDTYTTEPELLGNAPFNDIWYLVDQSSTTPEEHHRLNLRYIGGDVFFNTTTDKWYVYHTWTKAQYGTNNVEAIQHRLQFNSSGVDILYIEANNRVKSTVTPNTGFPTSETAIFSGYLNSKTDFYVYCENRYASPSDYRCYRYLFHISDWETFGSTSISNTAETWYTEIVVDDYNNIGYKIPTSTMHFAEEYDETLVTIYYALDPDYAGYDVTWSYVPADDPPEVNKRYVFSGVTYLNEIVFQCEISAYVDDITIASRETSTQGVFDFWMQTSVLGAHNVTVEMFVDGESVHNETVIYVFIESTATEETQLLNLGIGGVMNFVILFSLCGVPAFVFMQQAGTLGFFAGLGLGAVIGYIGGVMPMYGLFLVGLICAVGIVYGRGSFTSQSNET